MAYKISGKVLSISPTQSFTSTKTGNSYQARELVITVRKFDPYTGYPTEDKDNTPKFTLFGNQCQQLDNIKVGDIVVVHFDIQGRAYNKDGKTDYFTEVRPFRVEKADLTANQTPQTAQQQPQQYNPQPQYQQQLYQQPIQQTGNPPQGQQYYGQTQSQIQQPASGSFVDPPQPFSAQAFPDAPNGVQGKAEEIPF